MPRNPEREAQRAATRRALNEYHSEKWIGAGRSRGQQMGTGPISGAMIQGEWMSPDLGIDHPGAKWKSTANRNTWAALSKNQENKLAYAGWRTPTASEMSSAKGISAIAQGGSLIPQTTKMSGTFATFLGEKEFYATLSLLKGNQPGKMASQRIFGALEARGLNPMVSIQGIKSGAPNLTFKFDAPGSAAGSEVWKMPFETTQGRVIRGGKTFSARSWVTAAGREMSFTDLLLSRVETQIRSGQRNRIYGGMRDAVVEMMEQGVLNPESFQGYQLESRARIRANQVIFAPGHDITRQVTKLRGMKRPMQSKSASINVEPLLRQHDAMMQELYSDVGRGGTYSLDGIKEETLFGSDSEKKLPVAMRTKAQIYPGIKALGKHEKGTHQIFQRHVIDDSNLRRIGWGADRRTPWIMSPTQGLNYEAPITVGYLRGKTANAILGDSSFILGSDRLYKLAGSYPDRRTLRLNVAAQMGTNTLGQHGKVSPWIRDILASREVSTALESEGYYEFGKPIGLKRGRGKAGRRLIGVSTATISPGAVGTESFPGGRVVTGEAVELPRGHGIFGIRATPGRAGVEYEFIVGREKGKAPLSRMGFLLGGTKRISAHRAVKMQGLDALVRWAEIGASKQTLQTNMTAHWFGLAQHMGATHGQLDDLANVMGLKKSKHFLTAPTYTATDDWAGFIHKKKSVHQWFVSNLDDIKTKKDSRNLYRTMIRGLPHVMDHNEAIGILRTAGKVDHQTGALTVEGKELYHRLTTGGVRKVFDSPIAIRSGVGAGLKRRGGFRLRLDHLQAMTERLGVEPELDSLYRAHAGAIDKIIRKRNPNLTKEARSFLEPMLGITDAKNAGRPISIGKYRSLFRPMGDLRGGFALEDLARLGAEGRPTALHPGSRGFFVNLPGKINVYGGKPENLPMGGSTTRGDFFGTNRIWIPSHEMADVGRTPAGAYYRNDIMKAFEELDKTMRVKNAPLRDIEVAYNKLHMVVRKGLYGKEGRLVPWFSPKTGMEGRLGFMGGHGNPIAGKSQALDIMMTEGAFKKFYGRGSQRYIDASRKAGGGVTGLFVSGAVDPLQYGAHYMPAMRLRLMKADDMIPLVRGLESSTSDVIDRVILAGEAAVTIGERDHDLDTIRAWMIKNVGVNKRLEKIWEQEVKFYEWGKRQAEVHLGDIARRQGDSDLAKVASVVPRRGKEIITGAEKWAAFMKTKYSVPLPELFFRHRRSLINVALNDPGKLEALGMGAIAGQGLTAQHKSAYNVAAQMVQQQFLGKDRSSRPAIGAMNAMLSAGAGSTSKKQVKAAVRRALEAAVESHKFRPAFVLDTMRKALGSHGTSVESVDDMMDWVSTRVAEAVDIIEKPIHDKGGYLDQFYGAFRGVSPFKSPEQMARVAGGAAAEGVFDPELARVLSGTERSYNAAIESINREVNGQRITSEMAERGGNAIDAISGAAKGYGAKALDGIKGLWKSGGWGKAAIIGGGALITKGMFDTFSGPDTINPTNGQGMPNTVLPMGDGPNMALHGVPINLGQVKSGGGYGFEMDQQNSPMFSDLQEALLGQLIDQPGAYGYTINQNLPTDEFAMEAYIADKMRSDF